MAYAFTGRILRIDLSTGSCSVDEPGEMFYRRYAGGKALGAHYLLTEMGPGVDPLGADNILVLASGIMTGTGLPAMCRFSAVAKSPLTGAFGESEAGGWWGPELKFAGVDALVIQGKASKPVYLWVKDGNVEIRDATSLWGLEVGATQEAIRRELGDDRIRVASIGPAGERQVRYACIINEYKHANGRTGMGAVMGSKNLKAVAVRGNKPLSLADTEKVRELIRWFAKEYLNQPSTKALYDFGTPGLTAGLNAAGMLPTRNFQTGAFEEADKISWSAMEREIFVERKGCFACPIRCKRVVAFDDGLKHDPKYGGPEYEAIAAFGSDCGIGDLKAVAKANELANRYGLDVISTGASIAFAMQCFESGILSAKDLDGIELRFGNTSGMLAMVEKIARREGIGRLLGEGVVRAAKEIGSGAEKFALNVKGQELPMHEPRGKAGVGMGYAIANVGADHLVIAHDPAFAVAESPVLKALAPLGILEPLDNRDIGPKKMRLVFYLENMHSFWNCAGVCLFGYAPRAWTPPEKMVEMVRASTGWDTSLWELAKVGERSVNMARAFNVREGFSRQDDTLPDIFFQPMKGGALDGTYISREQFEESLTALYEMKGWDPATGAPTRGKLEELDIGWVYRKMVEASR